MSKHLKRLTTPRTWPIEPKRTVFVTRPQPGAHPLRHGVPLSILLRDMLQLARTMRETKHLLRTQEVLVNGRRVYRPDVLVGLMDVVSFPQTKSSYRLLLNELEKLHAVPVTGKETSLLPAKVTNKRLMPGGKLQLGFHNGHTLLVEKDEVKVGDTLLLAEKGTPEHYALVKGATVLVTAGSHVGKHGTIEALADNLATITVGESTVQTQKKNLFVIGKGKPAIKL